MRASSRSRSGTTADSRLASERDAEPADVPAPSVSGVERGPARGRPSLHTGPGVHASAPPLIGVSARRGRTDTPLLTATPGGRQDPVAGVRRGVAGLRLVVPGESPAGRRRNVVADDRVGAESWRPRATDGTPRPGVLCALMEGAPRVQRNEPGAAPGRGRTAWLLVRLTVEGRRLPPAGPRRIGSACRPARTGSPRGRRACADDRPGPSPGTTVPPLPDGRA